MLLGGIVALVLWLIVIYRLGQIHKELVRLNGGPEKPSLTEQDQIGI